MHANIEYKSAEASGLDQIRIGDKTQIERVRYSPEVKGAEGLEALRRGRNALTDGDPLTISGFKAPQIRSQPRFKQYRDQIEALFTERPIYYYEPVELFRYRRPRQLVTYSFRGDVPDIKEFYSQIRDREFESAIERLPSFTQPFVEAQFDSLLDTRDNLPDDQDTIETTDRVHEVWRDADQGYPSFIDGILDEADNTPDSAVIPPVPPVLQSSGQDVIKRTVGYNDLVWEKCKSSFEDTSAGTTTAYLHFYVDKGIFGPSNNNEKKVLDAIKQQLKKRPYAGVAVTVSNLKNIWDAGYEGALERFVSELEVISHDHSVPLVAPRSGYYGMYLTDYGVDIFSSLMNGNLELNRKSGAPGGAAMYGKLPIYDMCDDVTVDNLTNILARRQGRLYSVNGIPDSPPVFNPNTNDVEDQFGKPKQFRVKFGKQRRLVHNKEARELQEEIKRGTPNPASHYFTGAEANHPHLS